MSGRKAMVVNGSSFSLSVLVTAAVYIPEDNGALCYLHSATEFPVLPTRLIDAVHSQECSLLLHWELSIDP